MRPEWRQRLAAAVDSTGMERKEIAAKAETSAPTLSKVLSGNGDKEPGFGLVVKIARAAGVSLDTVTGDGPIQSTLTPYDKDPRIRHACDRLVTVPPETQRAILHAWEWLLTGAGAAPEGRADVSDGGVNQIYTPGFDGTRNKDGVGERGAEGTPQGDVDE